MTMTNSPDLILAQAAGGGLEGFVPLILILGVFYFLLIRPQQQRAKQHAELVAGLKRGDKVVMADGLHGRIADLDEATVLVEVGPDNDKKVKLRFDRDRVGRKAGDKKES